MFRLSNSIILGMALLTLMSCGKSELSPTEYMAWVEDDDHGLVVHKDLGDFEYSLLCKPVDYILAKELSSGALKKEQIEARRKDLGNMQYFTLKIKAKEAKELMSAGIGSENEYYQRLEYFMGPMSEDISMIIGKDTVACALHHFERNYGLAPYNTFDLGFELGPDKHTGDETFVYDDKVLGTGKVMLTISEDRLKNVPTIKWN